MTYRRLSSRDYSRARQHLSERAELSRLFGGIDAEIETLFLTLPAQVLNRLLVLYEQRYGARAASYARVTYPKWQRRQVRLSGQTAQRLLELIPPLLPERVRFDLLRKLRTHHLPKQAVRVTTDPARWMVAVRPAVDSLVERSRSYNLPTEVVDRAKWLANADSAATMRLLGALEEEEARARLAYLDEEFERIRVLVANLKNARSVRHTIQLPQGRVEVEIRAPRQSLGGRFGTLFTQRVAMDETSRNQLARLNPSRAVTRSDQPSLLEETLADLSPEQATRLRGRAVEERLSLEVDQAQADARFINSTRDMGNTLNLVKEMDRTLKTDYDIRSQFNTASGKTDIHVKKNNNVMIMVVAVVVAIAIIIFATR